MISTSLRWKRRVRTLLVTASLAATLFMGVVTLAEGASKGGASPVVTAKGPTSTTSPPRVIAVPGQKAPGWQGGGWIGMGPFHGQGWPGN